MAIALAFFSLVIVLLSLYGVLQPSSLVSFVRGSVSAGWGLWTGVVVRLILAVLLWFSASQSLTPTIFSVLAILMLAAAIALPVMGVQRILKLMDWFGDRPPSTMRLWCLVGVGFGAFLLWSISPVFSAA